MGNALHDAIRSAAETANPDLAPLWDDFDQVWAVVPHPAEDG